MRSRRGWPKTPVLMFLYPPPSSWNYRPKSACPCYLHFKNHKCSFVCMYVYAWGVPSPWMRACRSRGQRLMAGIFLLPPLLIFKNISLNRKFATSAVLAGQRACRSACLCPHQGWAYRQTPCQAFPWVLVPLVLAQLALYPLSHPLRRNRLRF